MNRTILESTVTGCCLVLVLLVALAPGVSLAQLTVASPFTDNAILQRDTPVPVWGTADSGTIVTVQFADQKKTATADGDGRWSVELDAMPANAVSQELEISNVESKVSFSNVLVGEVWICSGQSNMQMENKKVPEVAALLPLAKNIRTFAVKRSVAFTEQDQCEGRWVETPPDSAVAFAFAHHLEQAGEVPVGIILACWGSSSIEAWMPRDMTETVPHFKTMMEEFDADTETRDRITSILEGRQPWSQKDDIFLRRQTNILYNAMIHPLVPYACRGLVWYQGERNTQSMHGMQKEPWYSRNSGMLKYGDTLTAWIQRYRREWSNDQMKFMVVMLPGYYKQLKTGPRMGVQKAALHPTTHSWAWMRESQLKALQLENTSVVNTIDLGDVRKIHPQDKLPVGRRLALLAARDTLGQNVQAEGPMMQRVEVVAKKLVVHFDHADGLKTLDGNPPTGFWLAGEDGKWIEAIARLDGETVIVGSPNINRPLYVRYAFAGKPNVNLVNAAELPAYPFRTDTFQP